MAAGVAYIGDAVRLPFQKRHFLKQWRLSGRRGVAGVDGTRRRRRRNEPTGAEGRSVSGGGSPEFGDAVEESCLGVAALHEGT